MDTSPPSREQIEAIALKIGAPKASVFKWRKRGIPGDWKMRIVAASDGKITVGGMLAYQAQPETEAA